MRVTSKGQVTIPQEVREAMGIHPSETEVEFVQDENGRWYLKKKITRKKGVVSAQDTSECSVRRAFGG